MVVFFVNGQNNVGQMKKVFLSIKQIVVTFLSVTLKINIAKGVFDTPLYKG